MSEFLLYEVCELIVDCPHSTASDEGKGYPLVRTPNIGKGRLIYDGMHRVCEDVYNKRNARAVPQENDLIFAREATAGNVALIQKGEKVCLGQRTVLIRPNQNKVNPAFLTYFLLAPKQQYNLLSTANGATVAHVNLPTIRNLKIDLPELPTQHHIATILSRYDSLIENYQKQIKLLEEAAQRLYKEWFVDLRFPGHENTKNVNGLPDGWEKKAFGSVIEYEIGGGWGADTKTSNEIIPAYVIRGTDMSALDMGALKELPYRFHQESNYKARQLMHNDIVFEVSGGSKNEGVAKTFLVQQELLDKLDNHVICASFCKLIRLKDSSTAYYIYDTLKEWRASGITTQYDKRSASSIVNYRWKDFLSQQEIVIPNEIVLRDYIKKSELIHSSITKKSSQIRLLTEARDRLLPKLMSGEIEVGETA